MENKVIEVWSSPISPALEESFRFQRIATWILMISLIILFQLVIWRIRW